MSALVPSRDHWSPTQRRARALHARRFEARGAGTWPPRRSSRRAVIHALELVCWVLSQYVRIDAIPIVDARKPLSGVVVVGTDGENGAVGAQRNRISAEVPVRPPRACSDRSTSTPTCSRAPASRSRLHRHPLPRSTTPWTIRRSCKCSRRLRRQTRFGAVSVRGFWRTRG